jgi:transposase
MSLLQEKIKTYLTKHPKMRVKDVADHFNVHTSYIYALRRKAKEENLAKQGWLPPGVLPVPEVSRPIVNPEITMETNATDVDRVLDSRAKDYGKFIEGAEIMQMLKRLVHNYIEDRGTPLAFDQREAIDMIIHKLGRIINGNPDKVDHWVDIAGYAILVAERLEGNAR